MSWHFYFITYFHTYVPIAWCLLIKFPLARIMRKSTLSCFVFFFPRINRFIPRVQENYLKLGARALIIISTSKLSLFSIGIIYVNRLQTISTRFVKIQMIYRWAVTQLPNCFHLLLTTVYFHSPFLWLLTKERKKSKEKKPIQFLLSIVT